MRVNNKIDVSRTREGEELFFLCFSFFISFIFSALICVGV